MAWGAELRVYFTGLLGEQTILLSGRSRTKCRAFYQDVFY